MHKGTQKWHKHLPQSNRVDDTSAQINATGCDPRARAIPANPHEQQNMGKKSRKVDEMEEDVDPGTKKGRSSLEQTSKKV